MTTIFCQLLISYKFICINSNIFLFTISPFSFHLDLAPLMSHFPICLLLCIKICFNFWILWFYYSFLLFYCTLFVHLCVTIYYVVVSLAVSELHYILVIHEPHSCVRYVGDIFFFASILLPLSVHVPNQNHVSPVLSFILHWPMYVSTPILVPCASMRLEVSFLLFFLCLILSECRCT
jgi:hypothetical protein